MHRRQIRDEQHFQEVAGTNGHCRPNNSYNDHIKCVYISVCAFRRNIAREVLLQVVEEALNVKSCDELPSWDSFIERLEKLLRFAISEFILCFSQLPLYTVCNASGGG